MLNRVIPLMWFVTLVSGFLVSLFLSWNLMASQQYGYSFWYDWYDIAAHIDKFGPQNRYIHGLEQLSRLEHERLFNDIAVAIHQQGEGLENIRFQTGPESRPIALLRPPEVIHLQDVANLVDAFQLAGLMATLIMLVVGGWLLLGNSRPGWRHQVGLLAALIACCTLLVLVIGPKAVFYQMHIWMFPADHEWFFYYQDSLMTTLMKAPYIFGGIATVILAGGVLFFIALLLMLRSLLAKRG